MELEEFTKPIDLKINHKQATFDLSDESHPYHLESSFSAIIIAGVKQRLMWPPYDSDPNARRSPLCKSNDNVTGYPQRDFPWEDERAKVVEPKMSGRLSCSECEFKDDPQHWKNQGKPVCESGYKLVLLDAEDRLIIFNAMNMAAKRVIAHYGEWFKNNKLPTFCYVTKFELHGVKKSANRYADLELTKQEQTNRNLWVPKYLPLHDEWKAVLEVPPSPIGGRQTVDLPVL